MNEWICVTHFNGWKKNHIDVMVEIVGNILHEESSHTHTHIFEMFISSLYCELNENGIYAKQ